MKMAWRLRSNDATPWYERLTTKIKGNPVWTGALAEAPEHIRLIPFGWKKPKRIFVNSMGDLFHENIADEWIDRVFAVMALCPQHTFQVLTKRAERMRIYMGNVEREALWMNEVAALMQAVPALLMQRCHPILERREPWLPLPNVWLGISAERQQEWDERKDHLRNTPAAIRFASFEPLLGPIVEPRPMSDFLQWAIVGGESGPHARPMHPDWARSLRDQCAASVPFFYKQWGEFASAKGYPGHLRIDHVFDDGYQMVRVGKKSAGRLLDGLEWNQFPEVRT